MKASVCPHECTGSLSAPDQRPVAIEGESSVLDGYPDLLTVQDLQELTGLSQQTIRAEINRGSIPGCRIGRRLYAPKQRFIQYMMEGGGLDAQPYR